MKLLHFTDAAKEDYLEAKAWYTEIKDVLGDYFESAIDHTIQRILANPLEFPIITGSTRKALVTHFPFNIFFINIKSENSIIITAVLHHRRNPKQLESVDQN
ncbi:type II toxin-antitoxin system RelE/ParE family toxin [Gracilimonas sp. BCB1]|uniref:type II toxin-antitoxin system RelE/ParE family toxin n=1 Tax=Gracilimonas sp. BCB1 TaxID=3152362 RepID=UPI0032D936E0